MSLKISVYVPCYNAERTIAPCIASLIAQRRKPDEILVVDDGSTDRSFDIAKRFPGIKIVQHTKNKGLATARNSGIHFSKGDLVASIDSDCAADPLWLEILAAEMERDPQLSGVAGKVHEVERGTIPDRWRTYHMRQHYGAKVVTNPRFLFGANTVFRREALQATGPYPTSLRTNGEDLEICTRMYAKVPDAKLLYQPKAFVHHLRRDNFRSIANTFWRYQTYMSWVRPEPRKIRRTIRQTWTLLKQIWSRNLVWDLRQKRWEGLLIALYFTAVLPWLQFKQQMRNRKEHSQALSKPE